MPDKALVVAEPLPTSYGADIYYGIGGWLGELADGQPRAGRGTQLPHGPAG